MYGCMLFFVRSDEVLVEMDDQQVLLKELKSKILKRISGINADKEEVALCIQCSEMTLTKTVA